MVYLGIDIGGTSVKFGIVTGQGALLAKQDYPVAFDNYQTPILDTVLKTSHEFLQEYWPQYKSGEYAIGGIGVSATGQIDTVQGIVAGVGGNIANWNGSNIKAELEDVYHLPVTVLNDANCAVLAEQWLGNARGCRQVVMITIGTGVGGGIIVNNQVLLGARGFAGELGHFVINRDGRQCTCGNTGCYEQYASVTALVSQIRKLLPLADYPDLQSEEIDGKVIFSLVRDGEPAVTAVVEQWIDDIVTGLVSFLHLFNPEVILIGGGVSVQQELFIDKVCTQVRMRAMKNFTRQLRVQRAALGNDAGVIGAVYYLIGQMQ